MSGAPGWQPSEGRCRRSTPNRSSLQAERGGGGHHFVGRVSHCLASCAVAKLNSLKLAVPVMYSLIHATSHGPGRMGVLAGLVETVVTFGVTVSVGRMRATRHGTRRQGPGRQHAGAPSARWRSSTISAVTMQRLPPGPLPSAPRGCPTAARCPCGQPFCAWITVMSGRTDGTAASTSPVKGQVTVLISGLTLGHRSRRATPRMAPEAHWRRRHWPGRRGCALSISSGCGHCFSTASRQAMQ